MTQNDPHAKREAQKYEQPVASREYLLEILQKSDMPLTFKAFCNTLHYSEEYQLIGLKRRLRAMENSGQLIFNKFKQYAVPPVNSKLTGRVIGHRDGFGFFAPDTPANSGEPATTIKKGKDYYISSHEMQRVFHGDIVEAILIDRTDRKGRKEIKILEVVEPRKAGIVGRYYVDHHICMVMPDDARIKQEILIDPEQRLGARHGQMVVVEVIKRPTKRTNAVAKIIEVLGDHMAPGMEIEIALREHDLPHQFTPELLAEVATLSDEVDESAKQERVDLRHLPLVTIDGEDARDFDDAVYCEPKKSGGWRLWVAIADVSYYVRGGTELDNEAIERGNSVYFPSQVIPMLPEKLSNGLCSLNPDVDRLCMVCEMTISAAGKLSGSKFYSATMRSKARFTYTKVAAILDGDEALRTQYQSLVPDLENLNKLYLALSTARNSRGAIAFETQESRFIFNEDRKIETIEQLVRNDAHKIIEECMILANVATAKFIEKHQKPGLYRVHDKPSEDKYNNFITYLNELGVSLPFTHNKGKDEKSEPKPSDYGYILDAVADRPDRELIQTMLLRSMRQAVYQSDNLGHFGLALESYAHFTSPIRRYPDLVVHRVIKEILYQQEVKASTESSSSEKVSTANDGHFNYPIEAVIELGEHCSLTERRADEATRDVADWLKCEFMQDHVGDTFEGVISTVTNFGLFVRLSKLHIEGLVHITSLGRDFYHYDDVRMCLTGENTGAKFRVGDVIEVQVAAVNLDDKKIDLSLSGEKALLDQTKHAKPSKSNKHRRGKGKKGETSSVTNKNPSENKKPSAKKKPKKAKSKDATAEKPKAAKRNARKKRPGKNARKSVKE